LKVAHAFDARVVAQQSTVDELTAERVGLVERLEAVQADRDAVLADRDAVLAHRDALRAERDAVLADRDEVLAEREAMRNSRLWRFAQPYRNLRNFIRTRF
jgi:methyl-accepting chemotaxis protein